MVTAHPVMEHIKGCALCINSTIDLVFIWGGLGFRVELCA